MNYPLIRPKFYFSLFKDIVSFIKTPHNKPDLKKSSKQKVYETIGLFILKLVFLIPVILFFAFVYDPKNIQSVNMADRFSPLALLLVGGFILPLIEEIAFRLSLIFKPLYLSLSSSALLYYFLTKAIFHTKISMVDESFALRISLALSFGGLLFFILNIKKVNEYVANFWTAKFRIIYYCSCLIFAWVHLSKYELIWVNILLLPIITLPQLCSAIIYGYTRVSFGLRYPLLLHITMNTIAITLSFLSASDLI
ncbi:hypothetical protein HN014_13275 [Aquimarina sp. TRL1]|uniref:hypothetical protein n=1 Tax=Aquimarina sp. (strain TRL1) TaxID=2736252 RepID=UPI00158D7406|nr:hypothetical protein [Aquimarina sp. TRL1]QKX05837.1 hypothetical protein HN014_13275 [Aquimarina sp. TRL1]